MSIRQISLTSFRNLESLTLDFDPGFNLIGGANGSGKTSLLEAIYILCRVCSFRTHYLKQCITYGKSNFLLFGRFSDYKVGLSKTEHKLDIKLDGEPVRKRSLLVSQSPITIVNSDSFELLTGSPQLRRQYLDWCLFHVEHQYAECWAQLRHALKQRNRLLKTRRDLSLLEYWDEYLVQPSLLVSQYRKEIVGLILNELNAHLQYLLVGIPVEVEYKPGWNEDIGLKQCLESNRTKDLKQGFTSCGVHRDNVHITVNSLPVSQVLSRGQLKRLCLALLLVGLNIVRSGCDRPVILLVDDLGSELDLESQQRVYQQLLKMDLQIFISNIAASVPTPLQGKEVKMFHVEHGIIKPRKIS